MKSSRKAALVKGRQAYIIRHGACEPDDALLGQFDAPLSSEGERQAALLAAQLQGCGIRRVLSSSLRRGLQTAEEIARRLGVEVSTDARLNEISYGTWDGLRWEEIERTDPETARRKLEDWWAVTPLGGESVESFYRRVEQAWRSLADHPARATAVVAHRAVNAVLLDLARRASSLDEQSPLRWQGISTFEQDYGTYEVVALPARAARRKDRTLGPRR